MEGIDELRERVVLLLKRYAALMQERDGLRKEAGLLRAENSELRARIDQAEQSLMALGISKAMPDEAMRVQSRKKLDAVIGEIDKILTTLND